METVWRIMCGLDPRIQAQLTAWHLDGRVKPGHDVIESPALKLLEAIFMP